MRSVYFNKILSIGLFVLIGFFGFSDAEEKSKPLEDKQKGDTQYFQINKSEEIEVTSTMTPKALKDCSATVNIVNRKDLESISSGNALDILKYTPGIFVTRSGDFGRADVDIRGLGQNCRRIAVLVDGKPEKMGLFGCAVSHAFPLDNVERIEVVKGPASVLYGGEALGGAVNIITRLPQNKFETELSTFFGSYNTQQYNLKHGGNLDSFKYYVTFDRRTSDGHIENSEYSGNSLTAKFVYETAKKTRISLQGKYFSGLKDEPGTIDNPISNYWNDYKRGTLDLSLSRKWEKNDLLLKLYRNFGKHQFSDGFDSRDYTNGALLRFTTHALTNNEFTIGGDIRYFGGKNYGYPQGEWDKREGSLFFQDEHIFNSKWIFSGGMRLQLDSLYGHKWCPHLGLVFQATEHTVLRASISKGFRSPQLNELYMYPPANSELEPERVWNYEIGFEQEITSFIRISSSIFHMKGTNLIETVPNPSGPPMYIFANRGEFSYYGAEIELEAIINPNLAGNLTYSYLHTGDITKGKPGQKFDFFIRYNKKQYLLTLQGQYITDYYAADYSKNPIPSYFLLNSRVIFPVIKNFDILIDFNNILDKEYFIYGEFPGLTAGLYRMPGRNIQIGVRFKK